MTIFNKLSSRIWTYNQSFGSSSSNTHCETRFLDREVLLWYQGLPEALKFNKTLTRENEIPNRGQRKLRFILFLRANVARLQVYRPTLFTATGIMRHRQDAQKAVDIAKETISIIIAVNQTSDIYRTQQALYNYSLVQALAVIFLATAHSPALFYRQTREVFYNALALIEGFSTRSFIAKRLWTTIRGLSELVQKIGVLDRETNFARDETPGDFRPSATVMMMASEAGSIDESDIYAPDGRMRGDNGSMLPLNELAVSPVDGQQISNQLINLYELVGGNVGFDSGIDSQQYYGYMGLNPDAQGGEAMGIMGNQIEFCNIMGELL